MVDRNRLTLTGSGFHINGHTNVRMYGQ